MAETRRAWPASPEGMRRTSREAILEAAERRFAAQGYEAATIEEIAREAGVSRGTPAYFFGSKRTLYERVFEGALDRGRRAVGPSLERGAAEGWDATTTLASVVNAFVDFAAADPYFVRLVQWESLDPTRPRPAEPSTGGLAGWVTSSDVLVAITVLCALPVDHAGSLERAFGIHSSGRAYLDLRKSQILEFLLVAPKPPSASTDHRPLEAATRD